MMPLISLEDIPPKNVRRASFYTPLLAYVVGVVFLVLAGYQTFQQIESYIQQEKLSDLNAVAAMKIGQIVSWRESQQQRGEAVSRATLLPSEFEQWMREGAPAGLRKQKIAQAMSGWQQLYGYRAVTLFDRRGAAKFSSNGSADLEAEDVALAQQAMADGRTVLSDIHHDSERGGINIDLATPLIVVDGSRQRVVGAAILKINPGDFLYPLIQAWPTHSSSAETLLVRQEGESILFLNKLRHNQDKPLTLRLPVNTPNLPSGMFLRGKLEPLDSVDYRGVAVVAAVSRVPGTSWLMVAKIDKKELFAPIVKLKQWSAAVGAVFLAGCGVLLFVWFQDVQTRYRQLKAQRDAAIHNGLLLKHFEYLTKYANDIILVADENGKIIEANERAVSAYGYTRDEFLGMEIWALRPTADDLSVFHEQIVRFKESGGLTFETTNRRKDGSIFPVEISARVIEMRGGKFLQGIIRDITERKHVEEKLRESEARFRSMADNAPIIIWMSDGQDGKSYSGCSFFNQGWHDFTGLTLAQTQGWNWLELVHPDDRARCLNTYQEAFRLVQPLKHEYRLMRHDGEYRWMLDSGVPRFTEDGKFLGFIGTSIDISEQKNAEALRGEIERAGRLNIAVEMASGLAHELSQPLSAANNYLTGCLHRMKNADWDKKKLLAAVDLAHRQTERAGNIINHLKNLIRKQGRQQSRTDINALIRDTVNFLELEIKRHGIVVFMVLSPLPWVKVSKIEIEQVLLNLLKNAIEAMQGVPEPLLRIVSADLRDSGQIQITVGDNGRGISSVELATLFSPFHTSKIDGLGLGLAICRSLMENNGGRIWAEAREESGAEFNFTLPYEETHE